MKKTAAKTQAKTARMTPGKPGEPGMYWGGSECRLAILVDVKKQGRGWRYTTVCTAEKILTREVADWVWSARILDPDRS